MIWVAYCKTCQNVVDRAENGDFVEAAGRRHAKERRGHVVIVGYEIADFGPYAQQDYSAGKKASA